MPSNRTPLGFTPNRLPLRLLPNASICTKKRSSPPIGWFCRRMRAVTWSGSLSNMRAAT